MNKRPVNQMSMFQYRQMQGGDKNAQRVLQGRLSREQGKAFEDLIEFSCERLRRLGLAAISKTPEPMRVIERLENNRFIAHFKKKAQPDYKGVLLGGRAVEFEAKHTMSGRLQQSCVNEDQKRELDGFHRMGALCYVIAGFNMEEFFEIPWIFWRDMKAAVGRCYVTPADLEEFRVSINENGELLLFNK